MNLLGINLGDLIFTLGMIIFSIVFFGTFVIYYSITTSFSFVSYKKDKNNDNLNASLSKLVLLLVSIIQSAGVVYIMASIDNKDTYNAAFAIIYMVLTLAPFAIAMLQRLKYSLSILNLVFISILSGFGIASIVPYINNQMYLIIYLYSFIIIGYDLIRVLKKLNTSRILEKDNLLAIELNKTDEVENKEESSEGLVEEPVKEVLDSTMVSDDVKIEEIKEKEELEENI